MEVIKGGVVAETKQALTNMGGLTCPRILAITISTFVQALS